MKGSIKTLKEQGFGFITPEDGSKDIFFHSSALVGCQFTDLNVGDQVEFETEMSPKGPRAAGVKKA